MTGYVALLRAVNVGGTGKLPMTTLTEMCGTLGFKKVKTYIDSGNVVFSSDKAEDQVRSALEDELHVFAGKSVPVIVGTSAEMSDTLARNRFADNPGHRFMALFADGNLPANPLDGVTGIKNEQVRLGKRELFILYLDGMADTRLRIPIAIHGTARNMNTARKLTEMTAAVA